MMLAPVDAIIAECSPKGTGALSLIRLTGRDAVMVADHMLRLSSKKDLAGLPTHTIHHGWVINHDATLVDEVLVLLMRAPKTFTGEDTVEISCHGNPYIVQTIIAQAIAHGARQALPGEFTQKAVIHGKMDLLRAEAINEFISAQTSTALKQSLAQLSGSLSHHIQTIEQRLLTTLALSEASFEFIDEGDEFIDQIATFISVTHTDVLQLLSSASSGKIIKEGLRVALIGSVNTGKSSLFNSLLKIKRSIVSSQAGTTRDTVEALLERNGTFITLIDTAGLRETDNCIEKEGIERSRQEAHSSDIILIIYDGTRALTPQEQEIYVDIESRYSNKIIHVQTKADLPQFSPSSTGMHTVSSFTGVGIDILEKLIIEKAQTILDHASASCPYLLTQRHHILLTTLERELRHIQTLLANNPPYELISYHLRDALAHISMLTGKTISEQSMDLIFREFCIGK